MHAAAISPAPRLGRATAARSVRRIVRHRWAAVAVGLALLVAGGLALSRSGTGFLPEFDEGAFVLDYFLPAGTSLAETDLAARKIGARPLRAPRRRDLVEDGPARSSGRSRRRSSTAATSPFS